MSRLTIIDIEWNEWNGFVLTVLGIEYVGDKRGFEGELFGVHVSKNHLILNIAFIQIVINSPIV